MFEAYFFHVVILVGIYFILAMSMQFILGYAGILNLAQISFFGIGAYTSVLISKVGNSYIVAFVLAGCLAMFISIFLALMVNKLDGDYLAVATMGFSFIVYAFLINYTSLTAGPLGIGAIPKPVIFNWIIDSKFDYFVLVFSVVSFSYLFFRRLLKSPFGRVVEALRDNELALKVLGKNTLKLKVVIFMISAFFAGIAGSLYAHYVMFIDPDSFTMFQMGQILSIVIIGGLASLKGTFVATFVIIVFPELLRFIGFQSSLIGPLRQLFYAFMLILIIVYRPKGFFGKVTLK